MVLTSVEPERGEMKSSENNSSVWNNAHRPESKTPGQGADESSHNIHETKLVDVTEMDALCRKEKVSVINYEIIEKLASDPCLTVRIAVKKEKQTVNGSERDDSSCDITKKDDLSVSKTENDKVLSNIIPAINIPENGELAEQGTLDDNTETANCKMLPGMWRPAKRRKKNLITDNKKRSWRLECMVPGCSTRAYSSKFVDFPDEVERRIEWTTQSRLSEKFPGVNPEESLPKRIGLCVAHFREDDFNVVMKGDGKVCKLKDMVTPSLFPWVDIPSNVSTGMDIFDRTRFSRELRLLSLMKAELHHMMNPPYKLCEGIEEDSKDQQHPSNNIKTNRVYTDASQLSSKVKKETRVPNNNLQHTPETAEGNCINSEASEHSPNNVEANIALGNIPQRLSRDEDENCIRNLPPRRCKMRVPSDPVLENIEVFDESSSIVTKEKESHDIAVNSARRSTRIKYPLNPVRNLYHETPQPKPKNSKRTTPNPSRPIKPKVPLKVEQIYKSSSSSSNSKSSCSDSRSKSVQKQVKPRSDYQDRFPRKCKFRMPYIFHQDIFGKTRSYLTSSHKSNNRNDEKHPKSRIIYHYDTQIRNPPGNSIFFEDQLYDIKIENCEDDTVEKDCSVDESNANLDTEQEQDVLEHFLAPYSNPGDTQIPNQEINGSVSTQSITSCVEAAMNPMIVKLELFQGRVESRLEQLEEKVNTRLENLEGKVSSCLEKLEQFSSSQHPKTSNVTPGVWLNKIDQISENSIPVPSTNGVVTPIQHMEVNLKPFAISEKEYEMMEGEDIIC